MEKLICPRAGTCRDDLLYKHKQPHIPNGYCNATTNICTFHCCEATPELKAKIEAEQKVTNY